MAMESADPLLAIVVVDGPPPPCERMERMKMRRKIKQEPRRFPISFDADEHQRKTAELAQGWKRRQQAKHKRGKLDDSRLDRVPVELWSVTDVLMWLDRVNLASLKLNFDEHDIDGPALLELGPRRLDEIGVRALAHRKTVTRLVRELIQSQEHKDKLDSQKKGKSSLKHWSSLQPVSQNQVSGDEGQDDAEFDEAGARADFQRAVMAWRAQHGRPQISDVRASEGTSKSGLGKKSLLASFDFGSGDTTETTQWKNPFA